jgi:thiol-disulfide isomerase/thioredoxin
MMTGLILFLALLGVSCDRFEHSFKPADQVDLEAALFTPLQTAFNEITPTDVSAVMEFYDDAYLHNNQQKADREAWFLSLLSTYPGLSFTVDVQAAQPVSVTDTLSLVTWRLTATDGNKAVVVDSTFFGEEIIKRGGNWKLYGNRDTCCPPPSYKQRVLIESFTATWCPSCPNVDVQLHQLQEDFPYNLSYVAYHGNDPLDIGNLDVYGYYTANQPSVVFQGVTKIIGYNEDNAQFYNQLANQIAVTDAAITLTNLDFSLSGTDLSGTVRLNLLEQGIDANSLRLKYVIIDKVSDFNYSALAVPCRNVVIAKGTKSLSGVDLNQPVSFSLPFNNLPASYNNTLPSDSYLVIWVQVTPDPFNSNATVYNALEAFIPLK